MPGFAIRSARLSSGIEPSDDHAAVLAAALGDTRARALDAIPDAETATVESTVAIRYHGQAHHLDIPLAARPSSDDVAAAIRDFTGGKGLAHVVDLDFGANVGTLVPLIAMGGSIAYFATKGNLNPVFPADDFMRRILTLHGIVLNSVPLAQRRKAQDDITQWLRDGGMQHTISSVHPLAKTADAHDAVQAGRRR